MSQVPILRPKHPLRSYKRIDQLNAETEGSKTHSSAVLRAPTMLTTSFRRATTSSLSERVPKHFKLVKLLQQLALQALLRVIYKRE